MEIERGIYPESYPQIKRRVEEKRSEIDMWTETETDVQYRNNSFKNKDRKIGPAQDQGSHL